MTTPNTTPTHADWSSLACYLTELRDALLQTGLTLRDYQFTLDSIERRAAQHLACQWIDQVKSRENER